MGYIFHYFLHCMALFSLHLKFYTNLRFHSKRLKRQKEVTLTQPISDCLRVLLVLSGDALAPSELMGKSTLV